MPYNPNTPRVTHTMQLRKSTHTYAYNPHPEKASRWEVLDYTQGHAQADRYSHLANHLHKLLPASRSNTTPQQIFTRLRASRILPPFPQEANSKTLVRLIRFAYQYYAIGTSKRPMRLSLEGLNSILVGGSE